jgi:hypothetical protein
MATENFMCNRKSDRHTRIVEYETVYFPKAVKYDQSQHKRIRGLPQTQLSQNFYHFGPDCPDAVLTAKIYVKLFPQMIFFPVLQR